MLSIMRLYGYLLAGLALLLVVPMFVEIFTSTHDWQIFAATAFITGALSALLLTATAGHSEHLQKKYIFLFTTSLWIIIPFFASLPFVFTSTDYHLSITDAFFESVSGLTTTGSTVLSHLDVAPKGILLWRSLLEWVGGIGIVVTAMAIFPALNIAGMELFRSESSDTSDKMLPRARQVALACLTVYVFLTLICVIVFYELGMNFFDSINHAMAALSTGGFSTHDASMAYFKDNLALINATSLFMLLGGIPLILYFSLAIGKKPHALLLSQTKIYLLTLAILTILYTTYIVHTQGGAVFETGTHVAFNLISVITTTGFASTDYLQWGDVLVLGICFLTLIGGCTGSTSGGIKIFRFQVMAKTISSEIQKMFKPHGVFTPKLADTIITKETQYSVKIFFFLFIATLLLATLALYALGLDFLTSFSGAATAIANVGPGIGDIIGPTGNFATLPDLAKWILSFVMIIGRLEIVTILLILNPIFWRKFL